MADQDVLDEDEITHAATPPHWLKIGIGELAAKNVIMMTNGFAQGGYNVDGEGVPHLRPFNVSADGQIDLEQVKFVPSPAPESIYWLHLGDIIFNNTNSEDLVGKTAYFPFNGRFVFSNHMTRIRVLNHSRVNAQWLAYYLLLLWNRHALQSLSRRHVGQASISLNKLGRIAIPLPLLAEQRAIARVLRAVQAAIQARRREIALERERKAALMQQLFTRGTRGEPTKLTEIGEMPASWQVVQLGDIATFKNGINFNKNQKGSGILTLDVLNMYSASLYVQLDKLYRVQAHPSPELILKPGDVLFVRSSLKQEGVGWPALFNGHLEPVTFCGFLIRARFTSDNCYPPFLMSFLRLAHVRALLVSKSGTVAITNISQSTLSSLPIPVPSIEEQRQIAQVAQANDDRVAALERETALLDELFRALLEELMSGRLSTLPLIRDDENEDQDEHVHEREATS